MDRHPTWQYIINWTSYMAQKYGGIVWEGDKKWDWGQALCRETYGPDWMHNEQFKRLDEMPASEPAPIFLMEICKSWTLGLWPTWVSREKMKGGTTNV